jgi:hypothetical protein
MLDLLPDGPIFAANVEKDIIITNVYDLLLDDL